MRTLDFQTCLGLKKVDRRCFATPPPYSPNVVNQTVDYNGVTWKGQPGGQWTFQSMTGGGGISGGGDMSSTDPAQAIKAAIAQLQEANKPAVESLQASIPETQATYAQARGQLQGSQPSMEQRYQNLLNDIKGQQTADVSAQTKITSGELGKRGLTGSSTLAQQEIQNAISPLNSKYAGLSSRTGLAREDALRELQNSIANLAPQETSDLRAIQNAMAQLQSGAGQQGMSAGLNLYGTNLAAKQAEQQRQDQQRQQEIANALAQSGFDINKQQAEQGMKFAAQQQPLTLDQLRANIANTNRRASGDTGKGGLDMSALISLLGLDSGNTKTNTPASFQPTSVLDPDTRKLYGW